VYSDFYEIPLPALRFEKVEETHREVNDTEENDARPRQKYKQKEKRHERTTYDAHQLNQARITASSKHAEETTFKERRFQHTERHAEQRR
jgi:hypothetical protein